MADKIGELVLKLTGDSRELESALNNAQKSASDSCRKIGDAFGDLKKTLISALEGISFALITKEVYQIGVAFDDIKTKVAVATGDMGSKLRESTDLIREMFRNTDVSLKEAGDMMVIFRNTMGLTNDEIKKQYSMWETWMDITGKGTEVLAQTDQVMRAFGLTTQEQAKELMDYALTIQRLTPIGFDPLMNTLAQAGPLFQALGMNVKEATAFLGMMTAAGLDAESATMALNYAVRKISTPEELKELIQKIKEAPDAFTAAQMAADTFGARGGAKLAAALREGTVSLEDLITKLDQGRGAFDAAAEVVDKSFSERLGNLKNRLTDIGIGIGEQLIGPLGKLVDFVSAQMPAISGAISNFFNLMSTGLSWIAGLWNAIPEPIQKVIEIIGALGIAFVTLKTLLSGHPIFLLATLLAGSIAAIGALVDAFTPLETKLERIKEETLASTIADQQRYDKLLRVKDLAAEYNRILDEMPDTAERQAKLEAIIEQINQIMPEANLQLGEHAKLTGDLATQTDTATGAIKLNVDALNEQAKAIKNGLQAKYDAAAADRDAAKAMYDYYSAQMLTALQAGKTGTEIEALRQKLLEQGKAYLDAKAKVEAYSMALNSMKFPELRSELDKVNQELKSLGEGSDARARAELEKTKNAIIDQIIDTEIKINGHKEEWEKIGAQLGKEWVAGVILGVQSQGGYLDSGITAYMGKWLGHSLPEWYNTAVYKAIGSHWASDVASGIAEDTKIEWAVSQVKAKWDSTVSYIHKNLDQLALDMVNWTGNTFSQMAKSEEDLLQKMKSMNELAHNQMFEYSQAKAAAMAQVNTDAINAIAQRWEAAAAATVAKAQSMAEQVEQIWDQALQTAIARGQAMEEYWKNWLANHPEWSGGTSGGGTSSGGTSGGGTSGGENTGPYRGNIPTANIPTNVIPTVGTALFSGWNPANMAVPWGQDFQKVLEMSVGTSDWQRAVLSGDWLNWLIQNLRQRGTTAVQVGGQWIDFKDAIFKAMAPDLWESVQQLAKEGHSGAGQSIENEWWKKFWTGEIGTMIPVASPITNSTPTTSASPTSWTVHSTNPLTPPPPPSPSIPEILPGFAQGAILTRPVIGLLAEQEPEAVIPLSKLENAGFRTVNIYVELDGQTIARAVGRPLVDEIRVRTGLRM